MMAMYGICAYNVVAVRALDSDKSEMVTQLLFGDSYQVLKFSDNEKWLHIEIAEDRYQGWIDKKLHTEQSEVQWEVYQQTEKYISTEPISLLHANGGISPVFFASYLPLYDGQYVYIGKERFPFGGKATKILKKMPAEHLLHNAFTFLSTPYLWGGKSHAGIDCSGLVQVVFRSCGYLLKRDAWQQAAMGNPVDKLEEAKSGDLAFFRNDTGRVTHVGILIDAHTILHAHGKVRIDKIDQKGIINGDSGLYSHVLSDIKRLI